MESLKIINTGEIGGRIYQDENMCSSGDGIKMIYLIKFPHIIVDTHLLFMGAFIYGGFPGGSEGKASACNAGDPGSIPGSERFPGEGNGNPLQYSCLENPMDGGAW